MIRCLNCHHEYDSKFCPACGQKAATTRLSWHSITHDLQHILLHLDKGVLKNVRSIWQPQLIRDYIAGKRVGYFNPVVFLLFVCGIVAWMEHEFKLPMSKVEGGSSSSTAFHVGMTAASIFHSWSKYLEAVMVLPLGYFSWLFMRRHTRYNLIESIYTQVFIVCNLNLLGLLLYPVLRYFSPIVFFNFLTSSILVVLTCLTFNQVNSLFRRFFYAVMIVVLSYITYIAMFLLAALIVVKTKGI